MIGNEESNLVYFEDLYQRAFLQGQTSEVIAWDLNLEIDRVEQDTRRLQIMLDNMPMDQEIADRYELIAQSEWFRRVYGNKSLGGSIAIDY